MTCMYDWLILNLGLESFTLRMKEREGERRKEGKKEVGRHWVKYLPFCLQNSHIQRDLQGAL